MLTTSQDYQNALDRMAFLCSEFGPSAPTHEMIDLLAAIEQYEDEHR